MVRVFISYCDQDGLGFAERLYGHLTKIGMDAWMYRHSYVVGAPTWSEIGTEIRDRDAAIVIVTQGSHSSTGQEKECSSINNYNKPVYVLKANDAKILPALSWANWSEFSEGDFDRECEKAGRELPRTIEQKKNLQKDLRLQPASIQLQRQQWLQSVRTNMSGLDTSKLESYGSMIADGYTGATIVAEVACVSRWTSLNVHGFERIYLWTHIKKRELLDPTYIWDMYFKDTGRAVANGERNYFLKALLEQTGSADAQLAQGEPDFSVIESEALRQANAGFVPTVLLAPIDFLVKFTPHFYNRMIWSPGGREQLVINSDIRLTLVWSHRGSPLEKFIMMSPMAGIWHSLADLDTNQDLAIAIGNSPSQPGKVEVIAETVAKYELRERKAVSVIQVVK